MRKRRMEDEPHTPSIRLRIVRADTVSNLAPHPDTAPIVIHPRASVRELTHLVRACTPPPRLARSKFIPRPLSDFPFAWPDHQLITKYGLHDRRVRLIYKGRQLKEPEATLQVRTRARRYVPAHSRRGARGETKCVRNMSTCTSWLRRRWGWRTSPPCTWWFRMSFRLPPLPLPRLPLLLLRRRRRHRLPIV
jgi:hypothetical protein